MRHLGYYPPGCYNQHAVSCPQCFQYGSLTVDAVRPHGRDIVQYRCTQCNSYFEDDIGCTANSVMIDGVWCTDDKMTFNIISQKLSEARLLMNDIRNQQDENISSLEITREHLIKELEILREELKASSAGQWAKLLKFNLVA